MKTPTVRTEIDRRFRNAETGAPAKTYFIGENVVVYNSCRSWRIDGTPGGKNSVATDARTAFAIAFRFAR